MLTKPVEIQVGGRSVVNKDVTQLVEVQPENERFLRLLELLGEWFDKGKSWISMPIFTWWEDQTDCESTLADFKSNVCNLLIATSVAARGLDVKELEPVVNYDVPNHHEDYVHHAGRTGRAGRKGFALTKRSGMHQILSRLWSSLNRLFHRTLKA
uniref:Helicase C-terminal domain-containing protein n=1 Tax=Oryza punctata TaxID=4537 RepID=A0A0E0LRB5_ORYPU